MGHSNSTKKVRQERAERGDTFIRGKTSPVNNNRGQSVWTAREGEMHRTFRNSAKNWSGNAKKQDEKETPC
jgi:hypothetical protein